MDQLTQSVEGWKKSLGRVIMAGLVVVAPALGAEAPSDGSSALVNVVVSSGTDTDADGLIDTVEASLGTNPSLSDSDNDGLPDSYEIWNSLDPLNFSDAEADVDGDGIANYDEYLAGSLPFEKDSDGDGFWDGLEMERSTDPASAESIPETSLRADVNCDGQVDASDIQMVINSVLGFEAPAPADVNDSTGVDASDVQATINAALGF